MLKYFGVTHVYPKLGFDTAPRFKLKIYIDF